MSIGFSAVAPLWQDRPPQESLAVAHTADRLGFTEFWIGEMATYDAFALGTAVGRETGLSLTLGPLAVGVRTATTIAMGTASVSDLTGRPTRVAIGASSPVVVDRWHGRPWSDTATQIAETAGILRTLLDGERTDHSGRRAASHGFRLRLDPPRAHLTIAAFGPTTIRRATPLADRILLNMVTPATAARLVDAVRTAAEAGGAAPPPVAVWLVSSVEPSAADHAQMARTRVGYLSAPGYGEMLTEAGFGDIVELARSGAPLDQVTAAIPPELDSVVGLVGSTTSIDERAREYEAAGVSELCIVPATASDPDGNRSLAVFAGR